LKNGKANGPRESQGPVTLLRMRETYEKRMKINEIIFIRTELKKCLEMPAYEHRTSGVPLSRIQRVPIVRLSYKPYVRMRTKLLSMLKQMFLSSRA
jgi:hypothetical protein